MSFLSHLTTKFSQFTQQIKKSHTTTTTHTIVRLSRFVVGFWRHLTLLHTVSFRMIS